VKPYPSIHDRPGIYEFVRAHVASAGPGLTDGGEVLPDEEVLRSRARVAWVPGALDGAAGYEREADDRTKAAQSVADLLPPTLARPTERALRLFYATLDECAARDIVDLLTRFLARRGVRRERLRTLATWLATTAPDREPVKVGIALLGLAGLDDRVDIVQLLGRHEEFTLYATVALKNGLAQPERDLYTLAQQVTGWGRIQTVRRLADTQDPEIRDWILRTGFRNTVMNEYLANIAATTGGLAGALQQPEPDPELLLAAGEILTALFVGGPAKGIDDYDDGAIATERFLEHLPDRAESLDAGIAIATIEQFLLRDGDEWSDREQRGWTPERRARLQSQCGDLLARPIWTELVTSGLSSTDAHDFWIADHLAGRVDIDTFPIHRARLEANPVDPVSWFRAFALADETRTTDLIHFASERLPLADIATGADDAIGLGPGFEANGSLDAVLHQLPTRPGAGANIVTAGLRSPVTRNRNLALRVLQSWNPDQWPAHARELVTECAANDPNAQTRETAAELIASMQPNP
jgi:hypothetical protein